MDLRPDVILSQGRLMPDLKNPWENSPKPRSFYDTMERSRMEFERRNSRFASYNIMQYSNRPRTATAYDFSDFYKYVVGAQIPRGQGASVADIAFVYERENSYGILVQHLVYDGEDGNEDSHLPGVIINEILDRYEIETTLDFMSICQPVPHLAPRSEEYIERDHHFLREIGLEEWTMDMGDCPLGYFFSLGELRDNPSCIRVLREWKLYYKYLGISEDTSYVEICPKSRRYQVK
jgi:hypothetical protein